MFAYGSAKMETQWKYNYTSAPKYQIGNGLNYKYGLLSRELFYGHSGIVVAFDCNVCDHVSICICYHRIKLQR